MPRVTGFIYDEESTDALSDSIQIIMRQAQMSRVTAFIYDEGNRDA